MEKRTKEIIQYGSAVWVLLIGSGLSVASFIVSSGQIHDSVLWFYAQCLMWCGAVFGFSLYVNDRFKRIEHKIHNKLNKENETDK